MKNIILTTTALFCLLMGFTAYQYFKFNDGKFHLVFCNVGQGDGIFIRTPSGKDIIIDSGPDDSILNCLSENMPFWDRTIELTFLTHPHEDHMRGFISIFKRYEVHNFATEELENDTVLYREVIKNAGKVQKLYSGDRFKIADGLELGVLGPSKEFLNRTSPMGVINESEGFGNLIILVSYGNFKAVLTGDSQIEGLRDAIVEPFPLDVFQIPHHGSKYGTDVQLLNELSPKLAVISVGKNKYGHPSPTVLKILNELGIKTLRTDQKGDIEIVVDNAGNFFVR